MALNGWQRLSVVLMVLWTITIAIVGFERWPPTPQKPPEHVARSSVSDDSTLDWEAFDRWYMTTLHSRRVNLVRSTLPLAAITAIREADAIGSASLASDVRSEKFWPTISLASMPVSGS